jgi:hypothetical protein
MGGEHWGSDIVMLEELLRWPYRSFPSRTAGACRQSSGSCGDLKGRIPRRWPGDAKEAELLAWIGSRAPSLGDLIGPLPPVNPGRCDTRKTTLAPTRLSRSPKTTSVVFGLREIPSPESNALYSLRHLLTRPRVGNTPRQQGWETLVPKQLLSVGSQDAVLPS